jgi:hypothetical protein
LVGGRAGLSVNGHSDSRVGGQGRRERIRRGGEV